IFYIDRSEIDAEPRLTGRVGDARVQLGRRKHDDTADRTYWPDLKSKVDGLNRSRQRSWILLQVLRSCGTVGLVPLIVVINVGIIFDWFAPIPRMESDTIIRIDFINRHPPIELALWGRIPRISMRVPRISNARCKVIVTGGTPHAR